MKPENFPQEPVHLWNIFYDFTQTPRPSKAEEKIQQYLKNIAITQKLEWIQDEAGNIVIYVPGKNGREGDDPLLIQNHIDMVTDALPQVSINFKHDPINTKVDGEWLKAEGTTLGADNGIGCAAALATIFDEKLVHPPLELLFTVDEETGLNGALGLESKYLKAKKMLNLDTEEWGSLYIGCAGGIDYEVSHEFDLVVPKAKEFYKLQVEGFVGGHSGLDIHEQRGNAIKFLGECLASLDGELEIAEIRGGKAHNIIPRDAFALISVGNLAQGKVKVEELISRWRSFLPEYDRGFKVVWEQVNAPEYVLKPADKQNLLSFISLFPHGVSTYESLEQKLPATSNNFARLLLVGGKFYVQSSLRFFDRNEVKSLEDKVLNLGKAFGYRVERHSEYPSWKPIWESELLEKIKACFQEMYHRQPEVKAIHAGLECGILKDKMGEVDVVSFGPTIMGAHSPDERVHIPSVSKFWEFFTRVLVTI